MIFILFEIVFWLINFKQILIYYISSIIFCSVKKFKKIVGDSINISWTAPYFPRAGTYVIYHRNTNVTSIIIRVSSTKVHVPNEQKYKYTSLPNSTSISFEIMNITLGDAGYYTGGEKLDAACSGGGIVVIVLGKLCFIKYYFS